jgi:DNA-binding sugar fermentation-stimulating protein
MRGYSMRIPDDVEELVLAFMDIEKKADLRWMTREQIDTLIMSEVDCAVEPGYVEKNDEPGAFPFKVTQRGREILQILAPCKRSGR